MKSLLQLLVGFSRIFLLFTLGMLTFHLTQAQKNSNGGKEAQSLENIDLQARENSHFGEGWDKQETDSKELGLEKSLLQKFDHLEKRLEKGKRKQTKPPLPIVLLFLGLILSLIWIGFIILAILAAIGSISGFLLFLILAILLAPIGILGIAMAVNYISGSAGN